jgi:hypothetical protein
LNLFDCAGPRCSAPASQIYLIFVVFEIGKGFSLANGDAHGFICAVLGRATSGGFTLAFYVVATEFDIQPGQCVVIAIATAVELNLSLGSQRHALPTGHKVISHCTQGKDGIQALLLFIVIIADVVYEPLWVRKTYERITG